MARAAIVSRTFPLENADRDSVRFSSLFPTRVEGVDVYDALLLEQLPSV